CARCEPYYGNPLDYW
nr:immunoglobulin heavy chain junction region [Mus musculus]NSM05947.1 immunoglobulin heavy chain junction region [Mus musculus]